MSLVVTFYAQNANAYASVVSKIASLLAARGQRVLVVDWSVAPREQQSRLSLSENTNAPGLLELLMNHREGAKGPGWRDCLLRPLKFGGAFLLPAGGADRLALVQPFDWEGFYLKSHGGDFLEGLRDAWLREFDTVLLYCPPGSRAGGICVIQMADVLALVFYPDEATSANSLVRLAQLSRQQLAYDRLPLLVFPMPSVFLGKNPSLHDCEAALAPCYRNWLPKHIRPEQALEHALLHTTVRSNDASYLFAARLIEQEFRNAAELIPPLEGAPRESDSGTDLPYCFTVDDNGCHITLTRDFDRMRATGLVNSLAKRILMAGRGVKSITIGADARVEVDEHAGSLLGIFLKQFAEEGYRVILKSKELRLQLRLGPKLFTSPLVSVVGESEANEEGTRTGLEDVRPTRRDKN